MTTFARLLATGALAAWLAPALLPAPAAAPLEQDDESIVLGVMRRDGIVLPFAAFDGRRWSEPWPADLRQDLPISIDGVPDRWWGRDGQPAALTHWSDGASHGVVTLDRPATIPIMCTGRIALRSDYVSKQPVPPPFEQPFPKDGLVTSGSQPIDPIPTVPRDSPEWKATPAVLRAEVNRLEEAAVRSFYDWRHPVDRRTRAAMPIEVEALYRVPMDEGGWAAYYVEAAREFPPGPEDEGCGLVTFVSGWIRLAEKGRALTDLNVRISYCDRRGAAYMLPLGAMRLDGKQFWIYQISGHDREWYVVARPARRGIEIHAEYQAGTCPAGRP